MNLRDIEMRVDLIGDKDILTVMECLQRLCHNVQRLGRMQWILGKEDKVEEGSCSPNNISIIH